MTRVGGSGGGRAGSAGVRRRPADPAAVPAGIREIEIRRSARRTRSVSAYRDGTRFVVLVPARFSGAEEDRWVDRMVARLTRSAARTALDDEALHARARALSARYLPDAPEPATVRWSARQQLRWGSCTPVDATIRVSERLREMPRWVLDYVLVHELAHLVHADHGAGFEALVASYPLAERARGFLDGVSFAGAAGAQPPGPADPADPPHPIGPELWSRGPGADPEPDPGWPVGFDGPLTPDPPGPTVSRPTAAASRAGRAGRTGTARRP